MPKVGAGAASPLAPEDEARLRSWLDRIGEDDQTIVEHVIGRCRDDGSARDYFLAHARSAGEQEPQPDDRRNT